MRPRLVKLVRDRIGEFVGESTVSYEPIDDPELAIKALRRKLVEEALEYMDDPCIAELADVLAVVEALADADLRCGFDAIDAEAAAKYLERGGFADRIGMYVETTAPDRHERICSPASGGDGG